MRHIGDKPLAPSDERAFDARDVLAICVGVIPDAHRLRDIYDLLGYMTGAPVRTSEFGMAMRECRSYLLHDHPELDRLRCVDLPANGAYDWVEEQALTLGGVVRVRRP